MEIFNESTITFLVVMGIALLVIADAARKDKRRNN